MAKNEIDTKTCGRCKGTGLWTMGNRGGVCYGCGGTGVPIDRTPAAGSYAKELLRNGQTIVVFGNAASGYEVTVKDRRGRAVQPTVVLSDLDEARAAANAAWKAAAR